MTDTLRVILEIGKKRRVAAGAMDWPGLDRWGTSQDDALDKLASYVGVRTELDVVLTPPGLARHRDAYLDAIRGFNAAGKPARTWPIQFLVRRTAHHVMDHAWELEDRG
jgi:hypothetical protein